MRLLLIALICLVHCGKKIYVTGTKVLKKCETVSPIYVTYYIEMHFKIIQLKGKEGMDTKQLVSLAKNGDDKAFEMLYSMIYKEMYKVACYLLNNKEDAEDAVSEAVVDMYRYIHGLRDESAYKAWAMKILNIKCKIKMRQYYKKEEDLETISECDHGTDVIGQAVQRTDIISAMKFLSEEERTIVVYSSIAGMTSDEVGNVLGINSSTVRSKLRRALEKLRTRLEVGV